MVSKVLRRNYRKSTVPGHERSPREKNSLSLLDPELHDTVIELGLRHPTSLEL